MKTIRFIICLIFSFLTITSKAQNKNLSKQQIDQDLAFLTKTLNEKSSYVYLNGYDFNKSLENYKQNLKNTTRHEDFGLFLAETIGKIGDRHAAVRDYEIKDSLFLPFIYAPEGNKVLVLKRNESKKLEILNTKFPYLKNVDGIPIENFISKILPEEVTAPKQAYFTRAVRKLRDIQKIYNVLNTPLPKAIKFTLSNSSFQNDTVLVVSPIDRTKRSIYWDDELERQYALTKDEDYNKKEIVNQLFGIKDQIGYIHIPAMVSKEDAPLLFNNINSFMTSIQNDSKALIVDVRHNRNLFSFSELDKQEQKSASQFLKTFKPIYDLDHKKYSEYYFGLLNGKKLAKQSFYYNRPVYILTNEKSFSAASVFVAVFKGIPNIKIVGTTTDGSSGNSERLELPNSKIQLKISTMVSFQKDGKILDGYGTAPDIKIERDINQILWKTDTQLEKLRMLILDKN